ncbi:MAG: TetR family transcriptional regulator [Candidatus Promineifilaceae bacterium]
MRHRRTARETRQLIFNACTTILVQDGLPTLTLEAVANEAGLSKGGLLYHFPTKVTLIESLFAHHLDLFDDNIQQQVTVADDRTAGSWLRAYAQASIDQIADPETASVFASLFAAGEQYPSVLQIMRDRYVNWQQQVAKDSVQPAWAMLFRLLVDGLWFTQMYSFSPPDPHLGNEVHQLLIAMTQLEHHHA